MKVETICKTTARLNRWHVYEMLKQSFMYSGRVPSRDSVLNLFKGMDANELEEGIAEFEAVAGVNVRPARKVGWGGNTRWVKGTKNRA